MRHRSEPRGGGVTGRPRSTNDTEILRQAMLLFWAQGYRATSVGDLVKATGAKRSTLYRSHADKEALFLATLDVYAEFRISLIDLKAKGRELAKQWLETALHPLEHNAFPRGCLILATASEFPALEPPVQEAIRQHLEKVRGFFELTLRQHAPGEDPTVGTALLMGANASLFLLARAGELEPNLRIILEETLDRVFGGVGDSG